MSQLEVRIMDQAYVLAAPAEGEARLLEAVRRVDAAMCQIRDAGKIRARERIAVLAALNLAFELDELQAQQSGLKAVAVVGSSEHHPAGAAASPSAYAANSAGLQQLLDQLDRALADDGQLL